MNRQNFDTNSVGNYPLTIDRMAELQEDIQALPGALAKAMPTGDFIVSGCGSAGEAGYAVMGVPDGNGTRYELFEVKSGSGSGAYLKLKESATTAENSDGDTVIVRIERVLEWEANEPTGGVYVEYGALPRLWLKKGAQEGDWAACYKGFYWNVPLDAVCPRVQHEGGRVHLWGSVTFGGVLKLETASSTTGAKSSSGSSSEGSGTGTVGTAVAIMTDPILVPNGYKPKGDVLVPIHYNGAVSSAILNKSGFLRLSQSPDFGDTITIDTYYDL